MAHDRRSWAALVALVVAGLALGSLAGHASGAPASIVPEPEFTLGVEVSQAGRVLTYTIRFENVGDGPATSAILRDVLPPEASYLGDPGDLVDGVWTKTYSDVPPGAYLETVSVELSASVEDGDRAVNAVEIRYRGFTTSWTSTSFVLEFAVSLPTAPVPTPSFPLWVAAAPAVPLAGLAGGLALYRRRRGPKLEQVFLMHNSGMLIHHWAANVSPNRDIDILSGMFVILKEFVRDSFREKSGGLTQLQFGDSRMFLAEGSHSILAAVVSGERSNGLPGQIAAAVEDFERQHGAALLGWDGRLDLLSGGKDVVDALVKGEYGRLRVGG